LSRDEGQEGGGLNGVARPPTLVGETLDVTQVVDLVWLQTEAVSPRPPLTLWSMVTGPSVRVTLSHDPLLPTVSASLSLFCPLLVRPLSSLRASSFS
jgi:hypothetical protein